MDEGLLGKDYVDGEVICRQEEGGDRMFVIQAGRAVVSREEDGYEAIVGVLGVGDVFGEMSIFERQPRSATVRAKGAVRALTLDRQWFHSHFHKDPSLAYRILRQMSHRIRSLEAEVSWLLAHAGEGLEE
jgi:CRP-like cAMP-binding protein